MKAALHEQTLCGNDSDGHLDNRLVVLKTLYRSALSIR
jgi:hypothetical protein